MSPRTNIYHLFNEDRISKNQTGTDNNVLQTIKCKNKCFRNNEKHDWYNHLRDSMIGRTSCMECLWDTPAVGSLQPYRSDVFGPVRLLSVRLQRTLQQQRGAVTEIQPGLMLGGEAGVSQMEDERLSVSWPSRITLTDVKTEWDRCRLMTID